MEETDPGDTIWRAINGQKVGADVLVAYTETPQAEDLSASPSEPASHDPVYFVALTIVGVQTVLERAEGEAFVPDTPGIPTVTLDAAGEPSIEIPAGVDPPAALVSEILIKGSGPEVQADQSVTANYSGWLWDGTLFDSSWGRGSPSTFSLAGGVIDGWTEGLAGVPVGSQVLLVIPPDLGYGASGQGDIPGGATLVFVVDVLGAV
jgi:peptidylprolyl isomerase